MNIAKTILLVTLLIAPFGCNADRRSADPAPPPPDAARPQIKTESQLAADRADRLETGSVVANETPLVEAERPAPEPPAATRRAPLRTPADAIRGDLLLVNDQALSVAEVLYPLREQLVDLYHTEPADRFATQARRLILDRVRNEIGSLLVFQEAEAKLGEMQRQMLDQSVQREVDLRVSQRFGGSIARLENHLESVGLSLDALKTRIRRELIVSGYMRQLFDPQVTVTRQQLYAYYLNNRSRFETDETRELLLIELPFAEFLPDGATWETASRGEQARAKLAALRASRAAAAALETRDFRDVAGEFSRGLYADRGGSWGPIGRPLNPPYREVSERIFELAENEHAEPIQTDTGWYIVACGEITPASSAEFSALQDQLRRELEDERFARLANEYILKLAEDASISDLESFLTTAVQTIQRDLQDGAVSAGP